MVRRLCYTHELEGNWTELLALVKAGTEVDLVEDGKVVAVLAPSQEPIRPRQPGLHAGCLRLANDFDQPLPDEFWLGELANKMPATVVRRD